MDHMSYNPFKIWRGMKELGARMKAKNLEGNMVGEGMTTGGIIIFGPDAKPVYSYPEVTGSPIEMDDLVAALEAVKSTVPVPEL